MLICSRGPGKGLQEEGRNSTSPQINKVAYDPYFEGQHGVWGYGKSLEEDLRGNISQQINKVACDPYFEDQLRFR